MKYDKNIIFPEGLSAVQKTLDSNQKLYGMAVNSFSKSLMQFQANISKQINIQAAASAVKMSQELNVRTSSLMHSYKIVEPYRNFVLGLGSCLEQVVSREYEVKVKALASYIKSVPTQTLTPVIASSIFNENVIDNTITVPSNIARNISDTLGISDDDFEAAIPYADSKKVSLEKFALYLSIVGSIIGILINLVYIPTHDYISDKSTDKYQHQMLQEEHKQTELLEKIHIDSQKNNSSTAKEK